MVSIFLFDSNFFISVRDLGNINELLYYLSRTPDDLEYHTTEYILHELRTIKRDNLVKIRELFNIHRIPKYRINKIRNKLIMRSPPQSADLSLLVAASGIREEKVMLVTDDFKLGKAALKIASNIDVWPPSVFALYMGRSTEDPNFRRFFRKLWKGAMAQELSYSLSRKDVYPPTAKISWLIDRATRIVGQGFIRMGGTSHIIPQELAKAINRYLDDRELRSSDEKLLIKIKPYLEPLKAAAPLIQGIDDDIKSGQSEDALSKIQTLHSGLKGELQIGLISLPPTQSNYLYEAFMTYILKLEFLGGICSLNNNDIEHSILYFLDGCMSCLIVGANETALRLSYLTALLSMANQQNSMAAELYHKTARLAMQAKNEELRLKSMVGEAVTLYLLGQRTRAEKTLKEALEEADKHPAHAASVFIEFGNQLYTLGMIEIALHLYNEGFRSAVRAKHMAMLYRSLSDLVKCYFNLGRDFSQLYKQFESAIKIAKVENRKTHITLFNSLRNSIEDMQLPPEQTFPDLGNKIYSNQLPKTLQNWLDVIHVEELGKSTIVVCYIPKVGNIGINIPKTDLRLQIPESYRVMVHTDSEVEVRKPTLDLSKKLFVRVILKLKSRSDLKVESTFYEVFREK